MNLLKATHGLLRKPLSRRLRGIIEVELEIIMVTWHTVFPPGHPSSTPGSEESLQLRLQQLGHRIHREVSEAVNGSAGDGILLGAAEPSRGEEVSVGTTEEQGLK